MNKEIEIPEGYEARIEGNKVILEPKGSEDERIRKEISTLYADIDSCISELLAARTNKDAEAEGKALFRMEGLMVATLQDLSCVEDWLEKQKEQKPIEWSEDFEENIRILLHDKLTWRNEDGSISSIVVIDDKTLKDIVTGIWFYVGKEANKYPNKELKVEQKPAEKPSMLKKLKEHLANTPREQLDAEFEALKDLTIDKPAEWSEDERIRKSIILLLQRGGYMSPEDKTKAFAWLEKHKEQKPTSNTSGCLNCAKWEKCKGGLTPCSGWKLKTEEQKHVECIEFDNEFKNQISHLFASILNKEWKYDKNFVEYVAQQLLEYAKYEIKPKQEWSEDERIRKWLIAVIEEVKTDDDWCADLNKCDEAIAWLEKKNPANDVYPKKLNDAIKLYYETYGNGKGGFDYMSYTKFEDIVKTFVNDYGCQKPVDYDHEMWKNCEVNFEGGKKEVINNPEKYGLYRPAEWSEEEKEKIVFEKIMSLGYPIDANGNYATCEELFESAKLGLSQWLKEQISRLEMRKSISLSSDGVKTERLIKENYLQAYREGINDIINLLSEATPSLSKCSPRKPVEPCDINIRKMVEDYRCRDEYDEDGNYKGKPVNCMVRAYEQGIRDILKTLK